MGFLGMFNLVSPLFVGTAFCRWRGHFVDFLKQIIEAPNSVGEFRLHGGGDAERLMDAAEVVVIEVESQRMDVVLILL